MNGLDVCSVKDCTRDATFVLVGESVEFQICDPHLREAGLQAKPSLWARVGEAFIAGTLIVVIAAFILNVGGAALREFFDFIGALIDRIGG